MNKSLKIKEMLHLDSKAELLFIVQTLLAKFMEAKSTRLKTMEGGQLKVDIFDWMSENKLPVWDTHSAAVAGRATSEQLKDFIERFGERITKYVQGV